MLHDLIDLPESHRAVVSEARALAASVEDVAMEADESSTLHPGIVEALRASALGELMVPAAYGGRFEQVDPLAVCLAREALMKTSAHLDALFALQGIGSYAIARGGTEEQRAHWLPRVASCEAIAALALTEPVAGSDLKGITTTAVERGGDLVVNGAKSFISNAGVAAFYTTMVKEGDGYSLVLVPADADGLEISPSPEIIAPHVLGDMTFNGVVLPTSARLGEPGAAFRHVLATLAVFRISVAGAAVGLMEGALEEAVRHTRTREQFGRPLGPPGTGGGHAGRLVGRPGVGPNAHLPHRGRSVAGPRRHRRPQLAGQAPRHRGRGARRRPVRAVHGPVGPDPGLEDREVLPPGPAHAGVRGNIRGAQARDRGPAHPRGRLMDLGIDGFGVVVTGASRGLGAAIARSLVSV